MKQYHLKEKLNLPLQYTKKQLIVLYSGNHSIPVERETPKLKIVELVYELLHQHKKITKNLSSSS